MLKRAQSSWHKARMKAAEAVKTKKFARLEAKALYGGKVSCALHARSGPRRPPVRAVVPRTLDAHLCCPARVVSGT